MGQCSGSAALIVELPLYADASSEVQFYGELRQIDHGSCNKQWHFQRFPSEPIDISLAGLDDSVTFIFALYVADPANFPFERACKIALKVIYEFENRGGIESVKLVCFSSHDYEKYSETLRTFR